MGDEWTLTHSALSGNFPIVKCESVLFEGVELLSN